MESVVLLEREREIVFMRGLLDRARHNQGCVGIAEGEAGVGKTALMSSAAELGAGLGFIVLRARGAELERDLAYGVSRQLFEAQVRRASTERRERMLEGAAALAAPALGLVPVDDPGRADVDALFAAQHGLYWLADNLTGVAPLLLCVDDAQWADHMSMRWVSYLARRLDGLAVAVLLGWRTGEPGSDLTLLTDLSREPAVETVTLARLSESAVATLVRTRLDGAADDFCRACYRMTGGNPFLVHELIEAVIAEQLSPTSASVSRMRSLGPTGVARSVRRRLTALNSSAERLAEAVAVLAADTALPQVAAVARLTHRQVREAAGELQRVRIFAEDEFFQFTHPVLRNAVYQDIPAAIRTGLHYAAAHALASNEDTADRAAVHLLSVPAAGDEWVIDCLRAAAARALARGAADVAVTLLNRASAEPPALRLRGHVSLELGRAQRLAGLPEACASLRTALDRMADPAGRCQAARELGLALTYASRPEEAVDILQAEVSRMFTADREQALRLAADLMAVAPNANVNHAAMLAAADTLVADLTGATVAERALLVAVATHHAILADWSVPTVKEALVRAWADGRLLAEQGPDNPAPLWAIYFTASHGDTDRAEHWVEQTISLAGRRGSMNGLAFATILRGHVHYERGDLGFAEVDARAALNVAVHTRSEAVTWFGLTILVRSLTQQGRLAEAAAVLEEHGLADREPSPTSHGLSLLAARSGLYLALGDTARARADAFRFLGLAATRGARFPYGVRLIAAQTLLHDDDRKAAEQLIDEEFEVAGTIGWVGALGTAQRVRAMVTRGQGRQDLLHASIDTLENSPHRLELAYSLVELGSVLRRVHKQAEARDVLRRGLDLAQRCDAAPLANRAHAELVATGARPRRRAFTGPDALTATERRVAEMARAGLTNRQIAQTLFVTRKTIETHLLATYRKLGIKKRDELDQALP